MKRPQRSDYTPPELHGIVSPKDYIPALEAYADHLESMVKGLKEKVSEAYTSGYSDGRYHKPVNEKYYLNKQ